MSIIAMNQRSAVEAEKKQSHIGWLVRDAKGKLHLLTELQIESSPETFERLHKVYTHEQPDSQPTYEGSYAVNQVDEAHLIHLLSSNVLHACHMDLEPGDKADECVLDSGNANDCVYAKRYGDKAREKCGEWKPIKILSAGASHLISGSNDRGSAQQQEASAFTQTTASVSSPVPAWVDVAIRGEMARAVFEAIRAEVPSLGPWRAFDAREIQRIVDSLKPFAAPAATHTLFGQLTSEPKLTDAMVIAGGEAFSACLRSMGIELDCDRESTDDQDQATSIFQAMLAANNAHRAATN